MSYLNWIEHAETKTAIEREIVGLVRELWRDRTLTDAIADRSEHGRDLHDAIDAALKKCKGRS